MLPVVSDVDCRCGGKHARVARLSGFPVIVCDKATPGGMFAFHDGQGQLLIVLGDTARVKPGKAWFKPPETEREALVREVTEAQSDLAGYPLRIAPGLSDDQLRAELENTRAALADRDAALRTRLRDRQEAHA